MNCRSDRAGACGAASLLLGVGVSFGAALGQEEPKDLVEVTGTVVVEDGKGAESAEESGSIQVDVHTPHKGGGWTGSPEKVFLIDGEFTMKAPRDARLVFDVFHLDDGIAFWVIDDTTDGASDSKQIGRSEPRNEGLPIPPDRKFALRARMAPRCRIRVLDAETGAELEHVDALLDLFHDDDRSTFVGAHHVGPDQIHPTAWWNSDFRARDAHSPLELSLPANQTFPNWSEALWVHAPGYCWQGVEVDYRDGAEQTVKLSRGGVLTVTADGSGPPVGTKIRLHKKPAAFEGDRAELDDFETAEVEVADTGTIHLASDFFADSPVLEWPFTPGKPAKFEGIPAGNYRVTLEIGERFRGRSQRFAECEVEVKAGEPALAQLSVMDVPKAPEPITLAGTIRIAPGWEDVNFEVRLSPEDVSPLARQEAVRLDRDELIRDPSTEGAWSLPGKKIAPGTYELDIDTFGIQRTLLLVSATLPMNVEVGPPVDVTFRFVDAKTKAPLPIEHVGWFVVDPGVESFGGSFSWGGSKAPTEVHAFRVPKGRIGLRPHVEDYDSFGEYVFDVSSEQADITVPLRHLTGVHVLFRVDGKITDWDKALSSMKSDRHGFGFIDYELDLLPKNPVPNEDRYFGGSFGPSRGGRYYGVESAGEYQIKFPPIKGFEPIEPRDVTIIDQEFTEFVIDLVRKKS